MTPAVARDDVKKLLDEREDFLRQLEEAKNSLTALGFAEDEMEPGETQIGFRLPRDMFNNELTGLTDELRTITRIIRAFSELNHRAPEPIEVRQISTSDPIFFLALTYITVKGLGKAAEWALGVWKSVEEIRKLRAETSRLSHFTADEVDNFFGDKIKRTIEEAIAAEAQRLVPIADGEVGRKREQFTDIRWSLEALLARVERGMTVEVRMLPPPENDNDNDDVGDEPLGDGDLAKYEEIVRLRHALSFPRPDKNPILRLPKVEDSANESKKTRTRKDRPDA